MYHDPVRERERERGKEEGKGEGREERRKEGKEGRRKGGKKERKLHKALVRMWRNGMLMGCLFKRTFPWKQSKVLPPLFFSLLTPAAGFVPVVPLKLFCQRSPLGYQLPNPTGCAEFTEQLITQLHWTLNFSILKSLSILFICGTVPPTVIQSHDHSFSVSFAVPSSSSFLTSYLAVTKTGCTM
jgi:hypothetical protein